MDLSDLVDIREEPVLCSWPTIQSVCQYGRRNLWSYICVSKVQCDGFRDGEYINGVIDESRCGLGPAHRANRVSLHWHRTTTTTGTPPFSTELSPAKAEAALDYLSNGCEGESKGEGEAVKATFKNGCWVTLEGCACSYEWGFGSTTSAMTGCGGGRAGWGYADAYDAEEWDVEGIGCCERCECGGDEQEFGDVGEREGKGGWEDAECECGSFEWGSVEYCEGERGE
ncbi:hypothetical protein BDY19DRAFT_909307 [Irpex rosettiformis]|uniref:Uncharacterized protein n=1 Tax=Irpex rosettiformis TaxID=378272 RepID=A0ACB8TSP3_9APHY|nr:hypothetical protein BDY19DRAFT_909307 [Irpex rosettiformis]